MFVGITNKARDYAWGSPTAIAELLGREPSGSPEAELWLGAHPGSPSVIAEPATADGAATLSEWIAADPVRALGPDRSALPFLMKVLAAGQPLSLQAHPSLEQARAGFARENAAGLPLDAPNRNYRDELHKPELVYALSASFEALAGFRELATTRLLVAELAAVARTVPSIDAGPLLRFQRLLDPAVSGNVENSGGEGAGSEGAGSEGAGSGGAGSEGAGSGGAASEGARSEGAGSGGARSGGAGPGEVVTRDDATVLKDTVAWLLGGSQEVHDLLVAVGQLAPRMPEVSSFSREYATLRELTQRHFADPGIVVALLLNRVSLMQGEALYLPSGTIHAYLAGLAIEVMAASDNVLRGGLTSKFVDAPELLSVLDFRPVPAPLLTPRPLAPGVQEYRPDVPDFRLLTVAVTAPGAVAGAVGQAVPDRGHRSDGTEQAVVRLGGPAILFVPEGLVTVLGTRSRRDLARGEAAYVTADEAELVFAGSGTVFVATTN